VLRKTGDRNQTLAFNAKVALVAIGSRRFGKEEGVWVAGELQLNYRGRWLWLL
jgi:hypothetical protein